MFLLSYKSNASLKPPTGSFWSVVHMLYCPTEKEMPCGLGRPIQMSLDINILEGSLAYWRVLKCTSWPLFLLVLTSHQSHSLGTPFFSTDQLISLLKWRGAPLHLHPLWLFFFNIIFSWVLLTIGAIDTSCFPFLILSIVLPCGNFSVYNKAGSRCGNNRDSWLSG